MDLQPFYAIINWLVQNALLPVLIGLGCTGLMDLYLHLRAYLKIKIGTEKEAYLFNTVRKLVLAAESMFVGSGMGRQRMDWVLKMATAYLAGKGYKDLDLSRLELWIEAALKQDINNYPDLKSFTTDEVKLNSPAQEPPAITTATSALTATA